MLLDPLAKLLKALATSLEQLAMLLKVLATSLGALEMLPEVIATLPEVVENAPYQKIHFREALSKDIVINCKESEVF